MSTDLPYLLAGPIVRYTSDDQLRIWFLTRVQIDSDILKRESEVKESSIKFGEVLLEEIAVFNLFFYVVTFTYEIKNKPNRLILIYKIVLKSSKGQLIDTHLAGNVSLELEHTNSICALSCFKLHGKGVSPFRGNSPQTKDKKSDDAFKVDTLILLGDQIYADDVDKEVFETRHKIITKILNLENKLLSINVNDRNIWAKESKNENLSSFSCFTFLDFAIQYCLQWNSNLWSGQLKQKFEESYFTVQVLSKIVFPNTKTYMMLDDHEFVDDWNINSEWREDYSNNKVLKEVFKNAISAYILFQDMGNHEYGNQTNNDRISTINRYLDSVYKKDAKNSLNISDSEFIKNGFDFIAPTNPPTLFVDCRTSRKIAKTSYVCIAGNPLIVNKVSNDSLIFSKDALIGLLKQLSDRDREVITLVTNTPVLAPSYIESKVIDGLNSLAPLTYDAEGFSTNPENHIRLFHTLKDFGIKKIVILSGDIHFSQIREGNVSIYKDCKQIYDLKITQLTSSPLQNSFAGPNLKLFPSMGKFHTEHLLNKDGSVLLTSLLLESKSLKKVYSYYLDNLNKVYFLDSIELEVMEKRARLDFRCSMLLSGDHQLKIVSNTLDSNSEELISDNSAIFFQLNDKSLNATLGKLKKQINW